MRLSVMSQYLTDPCDIQVSEEHDISVSAFVLGRLQKYMSYSALRHSVLLRVCVYVQHYIDRQGTTISSSKNSAISIVFRWHNVRAKYNNKTSLYHRESQAMFAPLLSQ